MAIKTVVVPRPEIPDLAWAAGFFDGEGTFDACAKVKYETSAGTQTRRYFRASAAQKYDPLLLKLQEMFGLGNIYYQKPKPGSGGCFKWTCNGRAAFHVASLMWPWLGEQKKADFKRAIYTIRETRTDWVRHPQRGTRIVFEGGQ